MASPLAASLRVSNTILVLHDPASMPVDARRPDLEAELVALGFRVVEASWHDDVLQSVPSTAMPFVEALTTDGLVAEQVDTGLPNVWMHLRTASVTLVDEAGATSAAVERSPLGTFLTLRSLLADGTVVRTVRQVDARHEALVEDAARSLTKTRSPLVWALAAPWYPRARVQWYVDAPRIGLFDRGLPEGTPTGEVVALHRDRLDEVGRDVPRCPMSDASNRRRVDRRLRAAHREKEAFYAAQGSRVALATSVLGGAGLVAWLPTDGGMTTAACLAPLPLAAALWMTRSATHGVAAVFAALAVVGVVLAPVPVLAAAVAALGVLLAHAGVVGFLASQSLGRPWLARFVREPRKIPADLLPTGDEA